MAGPTGYEPLDTLKPVAEGVWLIDGPAVKSASRACRFYDPRHGGAAWRTAICGCIRRPELTDAICAAELAAHGDRCGIWSRRTGFTTRIPARLAGGLTPRPRAPGPRRAVRARAAKQGLTLHPESRELQWDARRASRGAGQVDQMIVRGSQAGTARRCSFTTRQPAHSILDRPDRGDRDGQAAGLDCRPDRLAHRD